jgi:hypothetical protein
MNNSGSYHKKNDNCQRVLLLVINDQNRNKGVYEGLIGSIKKNGFVSRTNNLFGRLSAISCKDPLIHNAKSPLQIPTYDGSGQAVHPSVIDFQNEYGLDSWGGYRYWMVLTPFPYSQDRFENPSLFASHDGCTWIVPPEISNPLDRASGGWDKGFLNDPDMIYNPDTNQLWIYYRFANSDMLKMLLIKVNPDMTMTRPFTLMEQSPWSQNDNRTRSFCVWREVSDRWHMWGCGGRGKQPLNTYYFFSRDGICWKEPQRVVNEEGLDPFQAIGLSNWHMSGKPNIKERRIEFLVYSAVNNPIQRRLFPAKNPVVYAECSMDSPTLFRTPIGVPVLQSSKGSWDNGHLYRCSFRIIDNGTGYRYGIWYSAKGSDGKWQLGYTEGFIGTSYSKENTDLSRSGGSGI